MSITGTVHIPAEGDNRPPAYWEEIDGREVLVIRASAIGGCAWELVAAAQGLDPLPTPQWLQEAFDRGTELEPHIISMLERGEVHWWRNESGELTSVGDGKVKLVSFTSHQDEGHLWITDNIVIRFHPDAVDPVGNNVWEIKALSNSLWMKAYKGSVADAVDEYAWQLSVMMHAYGATSGIWAAYNKGEKSGEPVRHEREVLVEVVPQPLISFQELHDKAVMVYELARGEDISVSGRPCDKPDAFPCRYLHIRPERDEGDELMDDESSVGTSGISDKTAQPEPDVLSGAELDYVLRQYAFFKGQEDEAKQRREALKEQVLASAPKGEKRVMGEQFTAQVVDGTSSGGYDWKSMPRELKAEVEKYKLPGKPYRYIKNVKRND